ncbi:histone acetyltransferase type B catalytic subunit [Epithele typhae]|uniref:histone acetyltransferase type B catalytic subunit n=1 Tax=Epithele typhae TaxID=378194 RepID=UPI00200741ED|nr:histone acetyltransferase type B catalytic subunit [Epithele typhae]KAH9915786.1 histone acetyltransferase type B catalytic subunit [Epithele typhae]
MSSSAWTADANEALALSLVRATDDKASLWSREAYEGFHPTFTYPIVGEEEKMYGYKDLNIDLKFASGSLAQYLDVKYTEKLPSSSAVDEVEATIAKFIPEGYYTDEHKFLERVEHDATHFKPLGEKIYSYSRTASTLPKGKNVAVARVLSPEDQETVDYEVYHSTWSTPGFREFHRRMRIFVLLYIEAGSFISEDEETWEFAVLYEKRRRRSSPEVFTYHFVGYSTLYPFYCFPERVRLRISQFLILPPYQQDGHGSALYTAIYQHVLAQPRIAELTVEDPAEAFEDLRDRNDLKMLLANERFMREGFGPEAVSSNGGKVARKSRGRPRSMRNGAGKMGPPADRAWLEKWRTDLKIAGRQFHRLVEMLILKHLDPTDEIAQRSYRLQVKERLYRFNYEVLMQLDKIECQQKLQETFQSVVADYRRILGHVH